MRGGRRCAGGYARYSAGAVVGSEAPVPLCPLSSEPYPLPFPSSLSLISPVVWLWRLQSFLGFLTAALDGAEVETSDGGVTKVASLSTSSAI
jgi:hypothetical protein